MRGLIIILALVVWGIILVAGCGGSTQTSPVAQRGPKIAGAASLTALNAELALLGKPLPDFLVPSAVPQPLAAQPGQVQPASYMTSLQLGTWLYSQYVAAGRTQWYEVRLTSHWDLTDVLARPRFGDADLYVFSPLRGSVGDGPGSLVLVGYSLNSWGPDQVGSFVADDFGGPGRYIIAVYGYTSASYHLLVW